ncbi:MAG: hypothetical protein DHS20C14_20310 [Phycisphaeraceae bacterium]|nr:MAG: hypothetical protein DHS20C14_20310 [Phycisphaeraceae bacterium]
MIDQVTSTVATDSMTATIASNGMILLVRYLRVSSAWYTGGTVPEPARPVRHSAQPA